MRSFQSRGLYTNKNSGFYRRNIRRTSAKVSVIYFIQYSQCIGSRLQTNNSVLILIFLFNWLCFFFCKMSFVIETLFVGGFLLIWLLARIISFRKIFLSLKLPGPIPLPIIGNGLLFLNKSSAGNELSTGFAKKKFQ